FSLIVGGAEIGVAIAKVNFGMILKSVNQPNVKHTSNRVGAVNGGNAVLQNVDVINQPNRKHVEVDCATEKGIELDGIAGKTVRRETPSILQDKGFFGTKTAQIDFRLAITEGIYVFIDRRSANGGELLNKISGTAHTEPADDVP